MSRSSTAAHEDAPRREICQCDGLLDCEQRTSDRFAYSAYYAPRRLSLPGGVPLLTRAQRRTLQLKLLEREAAWLVSARDAHPQLLAANGLVAERDPTDAAVAAEPQVPPRFFERVLQRAVRVTRRQMARRRRAPLGLSLTEQLERASEATEHAPRSADPRRPAEQLLNLIRSEVGYLFLDRTRISPAGYAVGEHVYSLSLAPGEEVTLEQKTFSKRETTFEEQTEQEVSLELELSSTLSTELQEGFQRQQSLTTASGLTTGGQLGLEVKGVEVGGTFTSTQSTTEADGHTGNRSVKDSATASRKVASKYRRAHKVTFKVSTEERFEATSKRVIRNPNRYTALNLEYFKRLHVIELQQERYGVRLCWAPCVQDPGAGFAARLANGRQAIIARALSGLEEQPTPPFKADKEVLWRSISGPVHFNADQPGEPKPFNIGAVFPPPKEGYTWNGDAKAVRDSVHTTLGIKVAVSEPVREGDAVNVKIWYNPKQKASNGKVSGEFYLSWGAHFVEKAGAKDDEYKAAMDLYYTRLADWHQKRDEARASGIQEADEWQAAAMAGPNLISELVSALVEQIFPVASRDECWELDLWQTLFDWDSASYTLYPAWWTSPQLREPALDPAHFLNASWAKVYIPMRVGSEQLALRWILGGVVEQPLDPSTEGVIESVADDLTAFRTEHFGGPAEMQPSPRKARGCPDHEEAFICLGRWNELMPADGTHLELVQGATSGRDPFSAQEASDAAQRVATDTAIRQHILANLGSPADVQIHVITNGP